MNPVSADIAWSNGVWVANGNLAIRHLGVTTVTVPMGVMADIVYRGVREVIQTYGPVTMGIEKVFMARNADSALKLGQARGAAIVAGAEENLEIAEYSATQVKQAVAGTGGANKEQVMMMVMHLLKLTNKPQIDASDALAIALCHAHTRSSLLPHGLGAARSRGGRLRL